MLGFYYRLALRLRRFTSVIGVLFALALGVFIWSIFFASGRENDPIMLLGLLTSLWLLSLLVVISWFVTPVSLPVAGDRLLVRIKKRLVIGFQLIMALAVTALCVAVLFATARLLPLVVREFAG